MMGLLAVVPLGYALVVWLAEGPIVELLTDGKYAVTTTAVICWAAYAGAFGAGIPPAHAVTATERSRLAFGIRALDNGVGVALAAVIAVAGAVSWVRSVWRRVACSAPCCSCAPRVHTCPTPRAGSVTA